MTRKQAPHRAIILVSYDGLIPRVQTLMKCLVARTKVVPRDSGRGEQYEKESTNHERGGEAMSKGHGGKVSCQQGDASLGSIEKSDQGINMSVSLWVTGYLYVLRMQESRLAAG